MSVSLTGIGDGPVYQYRLGPKLDHSPAVRLFAVLDQSQTPRDMDIPGFRLHSLAGGLRGYYAVTGSGNWRVTFLFEDGHAVDVDYIDYH